ncbi:MAG: hypothetical protein EOP06_21310 [Proteobacteria bacterium]|nr:MAG: hypothetical protein EOP06_21310 [Pseudomonadota bacterium]
MLSQIKSVSKIALIALALTLSFTQHSKASGSAGQCLVRFKAAGAVDTRCGWQDPYCDTLASRLDSTLADCVKELKGIAAKYGKEALYCSNEFYMDFYHNNLKVNLRTSMLSKECGEGSEAFDSAD